MITMSQFWNLLLFYVSIVVLLVFCIYVATRSINRRLTRIERSFVVSSELASKEALAEVSAVAMSAAAVAQDALAQVTAMIEELNASDETVGRVKATQVEAVRTLATLQDETGLHARALSMLMSEVGLEMPILPSAESALEPSVQEILEEGNDDTPVIEGTSSTSP